jgi:outer membrane protein
VRLQQLQFLPSLSLSTSGAQNLGRSFNESEGRIVDQTTQSMSLGVSSGVTLFDGGRNVAGLRQAKLGEQASGDELTRARQTAVFTVASNFLSLVARQEQLRVQRENLAAQQAQDSVIQRFVRAGSRPISDQYAQQAVVASAQYAVVTAARDLELAKVDIIGTLQLDPRGSYAFVSPTVGDVPAGTSFDLDSLLTRAFARRADLSAADARVGAAGQAVKGATSGRWPSLSLSVGYNSAYSSASDLAFADQLDQRRGGSIGVGVSIPLFDRGATSVAAQQAKLQEDNARLALEGQRQTVALEVRRAWLDFASAGQQLAAAQAQQRAADLAVSSSEKRYQVGAATLVEVTQARATQVQAASAVIDARYALVFQRALMSYYTGDLDAEHLALAE